MSEITVLIEGETTTVSMPSEVAKELTEQLGKADYEFDCLTDEVAPLFIPLYKALLKVLDPVLHELYYNEEAL